MVVYGNITSSHSVMITMVLNNDSYVHKYAREKCY